MGARHVAVVGAGLAGLSAAVELKRAGHTVDVYERTRLLGGKATSFTLDGVEVDNGQHVFLGCCTEFIDFVHQIWEGASPLYLQPCFEALLLAPGKGSALLREANLPSPLHFAPALLGYQLLRPTSRLRLGLALLQARRAPRPSETFAGWLRRHHQPEDALAGFWEPFLVPALNAPLDQVSANDALFVVTTAFLGGRAAARFGYSRVPLARIAEAAAGLVDHVHLRTSVNGLDTELADDGTPRLAGLLLGDGSRAAYDAVVLAVPPTALTRLLGTPERFGLTGLERFRAAPIVDVHLWYGERPSSSTPRTKWGEGSFVHSLLPLTQNWARETGSEGTLAFAALLGSPIQWVFEKGPGYLCCSLSAAEEHVLTPEAELIELAHRELSSVLPALRETKLLRGAAIRDREATFVPTPGLRRPGATTTCPEIVIAGAWTDTAWPATMESAVRSGRAAARLLATRLPGRNRSSERGATAVG